MSLNFVGVVCELPLRRAQCIRCRDNPLWLSLIRTGAGAFPYRLPRLRLTPLFR